MDIKTNLHPDHLKLDDTSLKAFHEAEAKAHEGEASHHAKIDRIYRQTVPNLPTEETFHQKLYTLHTQEANFHRSLAELPLAELRKVYQG